MMVKPIDFAMIQQQNIVAKEQHNMDSHPVTEQQAINQQIQKNVENRSSQVNKKDNADNNGGHYDAKDKSSNQYENNKEKERRANLDGKVVIKGQGSLDFDVKI